MPYVIVAVISIIDVVLILLRNSVSNKKGLVFKMISSLNFIIFAYVLFAIDNSINLSYRISVLLGLSFGFIGDFVLGIRRIIDNKAVPLIVGLFFFLLGHIMYIRAFIKLDSTNYILLISLTLSFFILAIIMGFALSFEFRKLKFGVIPYVFTSSLLLSLSISLLIENKNINYFIISLATLMFVISDSILCVLYFKNDSNDLKMKLTRTSSFCYLIAQNIFAFTIFLF